MEVEMYMDLYDVFKKLNIAYEEIKHQPVYTVDQAQMIKKQTDGIGCKNLFLTDRRGKYVLVILEEHKKANIKQVEKTVHSSHLSFATSSELQQILQLELGCVTPFGIINDKNHQVLLVIDADLKDKRLLFHPNINTKTICISFDDLLKFILFEEYNYQFIVS